MSSKFKIGMIILIVLILLCVMNFSFANDNSTIENYGMPDEISQTNEIVQENISSQNNLKEGDCQINEKLYGDDVTLCISDDDVLGTYIPYCGVNIVNPDFEDGLNGWNYSDGVFINGGKFTHNGARAAGLYGVDYISQYINFNPIDTVNLWAYSYGNFHQEDTNWWITYGSIFVYCDEVLLLNCTPGGYTQYTIDVSNITGWHTLKILGRDDIHYIDDITVVRNEVIDPYFNITSINVVDGNISIKFVDESFGFISSWLWDFGDGTTSTEKNPTHIYSQPGLYTITQTISDGNQFVETNKTVNIKDIFSVDFTSDARMAYKNLTVNFMGNASGEVDNWLWDFGDGTNSTEQNTTHTYTSVGNYTVVLTVYNEAKSLNITKHDLISIFDDLTADFISSADNDSYSYVVNFADNSRGNPSSWLWDFGDGTNSTEQNPTHKYTKTGNYNVTLIISSILNTTSVTKSIVVNALESNISIINISKKLLVCGVLKNQNGKIIVNGAINYSMDDVVGVVMTDDNGIFKIQANPNTSLVMEFLGDNVTQPCKSINNLGDLMTKNTVISISNPYKLLLIDSGAGEKDKTFTFYLKDVDGNPLQYKKLNVFMNNVGYDVYSDVNGKVSLSVKFPTAKTYTWKITFEGDDDFNPVTKSVKIVVSKKTTKIAPKKTSYTFKKSDKTKYITATLKTNNKYLKTGKKVTLTIKGKKYTVKAGKNGAIKFNIGSFKNKGNYNVKIKFAGDSIYKASSSKQITIKIK